MGTIIVSENEITRSPVMHCVIHFFELSFPQVREVAGIIASEQPDRGGKAKNCQHKDVIFHKGYI